MAHKFYPDDSSPEPLLSAVSQKVNTTAAARPEAKERLRSNRHVPDGPTAATHELAYILGTNVIYNILANDMHGRALLRGTGCSDTL